MFNTLTIPFGAKMLFNVVKLKPEYTLEDAELAMGEMCNVVKNNYRDEGGFLADRSSATQASSAARDRSAVQTQKTTGCWRAD
jgi:hypothetical protein